MPDPDDSPSPEFVAKQQYRTRVEHIAKLPELAMQKTAIRSTLTDFDPRHALFWIEQLVRGAIWGREPDVDVVLALAHWTIEHPRGGDHYEFFEQVYRLAHEHDRRAVLDMLRNPPPQLEMAEEAELPDVRLPMDREDITVGERRTIARRADHDLIDRLVHDPSPLVLENLLDNPDLEESHLLKVASRRPTVPELLRKLVDHPDWFGRLEVRKALVMNPYNPTGISLKLLPTIGIRAMRQTKHASTLHPILREAAEHLVDLRESYTSPWEV